MFIGHFAVAFAAKRAAPSVSLGTLFFACELVDLIWPMLVLLGVETVRIAPGNTAFTPLEFVHYPWTHSLVMGAAWALLAAVLYFLVRRNASAAMVVGAVVLSHWFLDALVHRPDLPLAPGSAARIGLGLWNSVPATVAIEGLMFCAGVFLYATGTRPLDRVGRFGLWALLAFLIAAYCAAAFGPPPPGVQAVAWAGLAGGIITALCAYWIDRHREALR
jgi:membrane-bound metal-dependent hydrolase YbcI (DUF457 family)